MSIFDFLFKSEQPKKAPVCPAAPASSPPKQMVKKTSIKVTNQTEILRSIELDQKPQDTEISLYCSVRPARIFCHSLMIDKLGDLTKFIISSLYEEYSIGEILELTQMGNITVKEEIEYLVRGGLVNDDRKSLSELGLQYGRLLKRFKELSGGIEVIFNTFANRFESIDENGYYSEVEREYILPNHFIPALARNDDYANSLDIAKKQIEEDIPFSSEIKNSLYTTVQIDKDSFSYKKVCLRNFKKSYAGDDEAKISIAIPFDRIRCRARYTWIDSYRSELQYLQSISEEHADLLSDKAKLIINAAKEEDDTDTIIVDIDTITGEMTTVRNQSNGDPLESAMITLGRREMHLVLCGEKVNGIRLEEIDREKLYKIKSFSYKPMEAE